MEMRKKGFEMQVHWIFILIAGAVILAFFFSVAAKQKSLSEQKLSITLSANIDAVFAGAVESKGTAQSLPLPPDGIEFSCSEVCDCNFYVGGKATSFRDKIIFAPGALYDVDAVAWSGEWKLPFRITNFLYITNPNIKYYVVYTPGTNGERLLDRIRKIIPLSVNFDIIAGLPEMSNVQDEGFQEVKFVFLDIPDSAVNLEILKDKFLKKDISAVNIHQNTVTFFEKEREGFAFNSGSSPFVGEPMMIAAIFSADKQMYKCGMRTAFNKLNRVARILYGRTRQIQESVSESKPECVYMLEDFEELISASERLSAGFDFTQGIGGLVDAAGSIEKENKNLILLSCPEMY